MFPECSVEIISQFTFINNWSYVAQLCCTTEEESLMSSTKGQTTSSIKLSDTQFQFKIPLVAEFGIATQKFPSTDEAQLSIISTLKK